MCVNLISLARCAIDSCQTVAIHKGKKVSGLQFQADVAAQVSIYASLNQESFSLYYEDAYPFCVSLFALLHSNKKIYLAANNKGVTADQLVEQNSVLIGDWQGKELPFTIKEVSGFKLTSLNIDKPQIVIFTSGSTGQAKEINKTLRQFQHEIEVLEKQWGGLMGAAQILATVSHQHIYGLLFRILWPLAAGRCFFSEMFVSPEALLISSDNKSTVWVASPAQLKRLDELTPWYKIEKLKLIFSSGGVLPIDVANQVQQQCGKKITEIYGSSETGGIAWRQSIDNPMWTTFDRIYLTIDSGVAYLSSPYLTNKDIFKLDDKIQLEDDRQFVLLGRTDRIVKVEEKRLSLNELEQYLTTSDWVEQAHTFLIAEKRDKIAAVLVLTELAEEFVRQQGRAELIKRLRKQLIRKFETVVLPRKWLFMSSLPITLQGKTNQTLLTQILSLKPTHFPRLHRCDYQQETVKLQFRMLRELVYFEGHFPGQPILPGVTQLAWAEQFGKLFFNIETPFLRMEVIKFKKIICPEDIIEMELNWKPSTQKLYFQFNSGDNEKHSSGRMVYGGQ